MNLIQIVPGIFPQVDGIGDAALKMARQMRERQRISTTFVVCDPYWAGDPEFDGFPIVCIARRKPEALLEVLARLQATMPAGKCPVLVHVSPYGYEKRGCPFWFVKAMEQYVQRQPGTLHAYYLELEVSGARPWSSAFWVPPFQRSLLLKIGTLAHSRYTHTEAYRHRLEDWGSGRVTLIQLSSSFGEPQTLPSEERTNELVIFGRAWQRNHNYTTGGPALKALCARLGTERIIDIGSPIEGHTAPDVDGVPILRCGRLEAHEIDRWMATTMGNFAVYPVALIAKSSVYPLACAHGNISFLFDDGLKELSCPGLETGVDFIPVTADCSSLVLPPLQELAEAVYRNYQPRASWFGADKWAKSLFGAHTI